MFPTMIFWGSVQPTLIWSVNPSHSVSCGQILSVPVILNLIDMFGRSIIMYTITGLIGTWIKNAHNRWTLHIQWGYLYVYTWIYTGIDGKSLRPWNSDGIETSEGVGDSEGRPFCHLSFVSCSAHVLRRRWCSCFAMDVGSETCKFDSHHDLRVDHLSMVVWIVVGDCASYMLTLIPHPFHRVGLLHL